MVWVVTFHRSGTIVFGSFLDVPSLGRPSPGFAEFNHHASLSARPLLARHLRSQLDGRKGHEGGQGPGKVLEAFGERPVSSEPGEAALDLAQLDLDCRLADEASYQQKLHKLQIPMLELEAQNALQAI